MITLAPNFTWKDRRPIGIIHVADAAHYSATNPASWLFDPTVDVTTPAGLVDFQKRMAAYTATAISILKELNAQGIIAWDFDGGRPATYKGAPQALYKGCPDLATTLNPELNYGLHGTYGNLGGIAQDFFGAFTASGFDTGVCIRAIEYNFQTQELEDAADPFTSLLRKATFAHSQWHCRLFYVDSNGQALSNRPNAWADGPLIPATTFARLHKALPGCRFIPEHYDRGNYHRECAPYMELRNGDAGTPAKILEQIPSAFSVINLSEGDIRANMPALRASIGRGDVPMIDAWTRNPQIDDVVELMRGAA